MNDTFLHWYHEYFSISPKQGANIVEFLLLDNQKLLHLYNNAKETGEYEEVG